MQKPEPDVSDPKGNDPNEEKRRFRILVLADSERDALLLQRTLRGLGHEPLSRKLNDGQGLASESVWASGWDIVILHAKTAFLNDAFCTRLLTSLSSGRGRMMMASDGREFTLAGSRGSSIGSKERDFLMFAIALATEKVLGRRGGRHRPAGCRRRAGAAESRRRAAEV